MSSPLRQFVPPTDAVVRALAQQALGTQTDQYHDEESNATPQKRRATVLSNDGGTPPTCTVTWDNNITQVPGIRFLYGYTPRANDEVFTLGIDGQHWVVGKLAEVRGEHYSCYTSSAAGSGLLTNNIATISGWDTKETNGLSEPGGSLTAASPTANFTLPFDAVWEIHLTVSVDTSIKGWGIRLTTTSPVVTRQAQSWAGAPGGGAGPMDYTVSVSMKRFLGSGTVVNAVLMNTTASTITQAANGLLFPNWISFSSWSR